MHLQMQALQLNLTNAFLMMLAGADEISLWARQNRSTGSD